MKNERKKIKEPFKPEETPNPPQQIDPNMNRKRKNPVEEKQRPAETSKNRPETPENKKAEKMGNGHLLNDDADIDDETTI